MSFPYVSTVESVVPNFLLFAFVYSLDYQFFSMNSIKNLSSYNFSAKCRSVFSDFESESLKRLEDFIKNNLS